jgi:hypothetical protein
MQRMLGGQRVPDGVTGGTMSMSSSTFLSRHRTLFDKIVAILSGSLADAEAVESALASARALAHPAIYPMVTLLSKLRSVDRLSADDEAALKPALRLLEMLAGSPMLPVRGLAARATLALVSTENRPAYLRRLLQLAGEGRPRLGQNRLHGLLVQAEMLLRGGGFRSLDDEELAGLLRRLSHFLLSPSASCSLVRAAFAMVLLAVAEGESGPQTRAAGFEIMSGYIGSVLQPLPLATTTVGQDDYLGRPAEEENACQAYVQLVVAPWLVSTLPDADDVAGEVLTCLRLMLHAPSVDVRLATADALGACLTRLQQAGVGWKGNKEGHVIVENILKQLGDSDGGAEHTRPLLLRDSLLELLWDTLSHSTKMYGGTDREHPQASQATQQAVARVLLHPVCVQRATSVGCAWRSVEAWQNADAWCRDALSPDQRNRLLQDLALEVAGIVLQGVPPEASYDELIDVWQAALGAAASDAATTTRQTAAVQSLSHALSGSDVSSRLGAALADVERRLQLWRVIIFFLCVEDEDMRTCATQAASGLHVACNGLGETRSAAPVSVEESLKLAFEAIASEGKRPLQKTDPRVAWDLLVSYLMDDNRSGTMAPGSGHGGETGMDEGPAESNELDVKQSVLFEREARNPYYEADKLSQLAFEALTALCTRGQSNAQLRPLPTCDPSWVGRLPGGLPAAALEWAGQNATRIARELARGLAKAHRKDAVDPPLQEAHNVAAAGGSDGGNEPVAEVAQDAGADETGGEAGTAQLVLLARALALCLYIFELDVGHAHGGLVPWSRVPGVERVPEVPAVMGLFHQWASDPRVFGPPAALALAMGAPLSALQAAHEDPPDPATRMYAMVLTLGVLLVVNTGGEEAWWLHQEQVESTASPSDESEASDMDGGAHIGERADEEGVEGQDFEKEGGEVDEAEPGEEEKKEEEEEEDARGPWPCAIAMSSFAVNFLAV